MGEEFFRRARQISADMPVPMTKIERSAAEKARPGGGSRLQIQVPGSLHPQNPGDFIPFGQQGQVLLGDGAGHQDEGEVDDDRHADGGGHGQRRPRPAEKGVARGVQQGLFVLFTIR